MWHLLLAVVVIDSFVASVNAVDGVYWQENSKRPDGRGRCAKTAINMLLQKEVLIDQCFDQEFSDTTPEKLKGLNDKFFSHHLIHVNDISKDMRLVAANPTSVAVRKWLRDITMAMIKEDFVGFLMAVHIGTTTDRAAHPNHIVALPRIATGPQKHHFWYLDSNFNPDSWAITKKATSFQMGHELYHWSHDIGTDAAKVWHWIMGKFHERDTYFLYTATRYANEQSLKNHLHLENMGKLLSTKLEMAIAEEKSNALKEMASALFSKEKNARISYDNGTFISITRDSQSADTNKYVKQR